jgi:hypothetical protein
LVLSKSCYAVPLVSTAQVVCTTTDYIDHRLICIQTQTETHEHLNNRPTSSEQTLKRTYKSSKIYHSLAHMLRIAKHFLLRRNLMGWLTKKYQKLLIDFVTKYHNFNRFYIERPKKRCFKVSLFAACGRVSDSCLTPNEQFTDISW